MPEIKLCIKQIEDSYNLDYEEQRLLSEKFHEKMFQEKMRKRNIYKVLDYSIIIIIIIMYLYNQFYFGK
jgi:predicted nucleic acid-binding Zn ribbon protein